MACHNTDIPCNFYGLSLFGLLLNLVCKTEVFKLECNQNWFKGRVGFATKMQKIWIPDIKVLETLETVVSSDSFYSLFAHFRTIEYKSEWSILFFDIEGKIEGGEAQIQFFD